MPRGWVAALMLSFLLLPAFALADIYSWVDDQGTRHYTTEIESVPEPYRSNVNTLSLPKPPPPPPEPLQTPKPKGVARIPFVPGSPVMVSAKINGAGPISMILDTGADRTLVRPSVLNSLGISTENATPVVIKGVTGTSDADAVWIHSVEVGEALAGPLLIIAHEAELKGADGLLGRDFLSNFNVTIDLKEQVVTLTPHE